MHYRPTSAKFRWWAHRDYWYNFSDKQWDQIINHKSLAMKADYCSYSTPACAPHTPELDRRTFSLEKIKRARNPFWNSNVYGEQ